MDGVDLIRQLRDWSSVPVIVLSARTREEEKVAALDAGVPEAYVPAFWSAIMPVVKNTPERLFQLLPFLSGR